jgi:DNA-damage-inducible protein D
MEPEILNVHAQLEALRRVHSNGSEYWMARDILPILGYSKWDNFQAVIEKAKSACESTGMESTDHFLDTKKTVPSGSGAEIERADCFLSRYACYLVAMNGETTKPQVGAAQTYFAIQTRKQERLDELTETERRIELRNRVKDNNKQLNATAKREGVQRNIIIMLHYDEYIVLNEM